MNNAGRTLVGAVEETADDELRSLIELHVFAPVALTRAVLAHMRAQGGGAIVQRPSVGGQIRAPGLRRVLSDEVRAGRNHAAFHDEIAPFGIRTLIVEPGAFRSGLFQPDTAYRSQPMAEYAQTVWPTRDYSAAGHGLVLGGDAIDNIRARLDQLTVELGRWEELGRRTAIRGA